MQHSVDSYRFGR